MKLIVAVLLVVIIAAILFFFYPVLVSEYNLIKSDNNDFKSQIEAMDKRVRNLTPVDDQFGIVINKIAANGKILDSSDFKTRSMEFTLVNGLLHPSDSAYPGQVGNMVIISQVSGDWYKYTRSNPQFYLDYKLKPKDIIQIFYKGEKFDYEVLDSYTVTEKQIKAYTGKSDRKLLTIVSGWPPGTVIFNLVIQAKLVE
ncbi:MAG: sortase [Candidatus Daviesbacteria bacterium]|nr:sortase [Candidatus Daviesbacteria bacterium]